MKKALILASVASMIDQFNMPNIRLLLDMGYQCDVACNFKVGNTCSDKKIDELINQLDKMNIGHFQIDFSRSIIKLNENLNAFRQVKKLLKQNDYSFVHCHSPIGGVIGRIAGHQANTKVIYTAHGFHFYKGAPLKNWLLYYPVEWICSHWTDVLINITKEDFSISKKKMKAKKTFYIPGVGVDINKFGNISLNKTAKKENLGIPKDAIVLLSVGELNDNKNHETVIHAINGLGVYYIIAGQGNNKEQLQTLIDSNSMSKNVKLLGFREDVSELYAISDIFVFPSKREGLSVALMEAMSSGLPCIVSKIRGNTDLIIENYGGYLVNPSDEQGFRKCISKLISNQKLRCSMGDYNINRIKKFGIDHVMEKTRQIYNNL